MADLKTYLDKLQSAGASELLLNAGRPPCSRSAGVLSVLPAEGALQDVAMRMLVRALVGDMQWDRFLAEGSLDVVHTSQAGARVRVLCSETRAGLSAVLRVLPRHLPSVESLALPSSLAAMCELDAGLVLVAGPMCSGKSSTLAALVDRINERKRKLIVTIEKPVELLHCTKLGVVSQRQVGVHCASFAAGIEAALALGADVIVVSELDAAGCALAALDAATQGVLVLGELRACGATRALERVLAAVPRASHGRACAALARSFAGMQTQELVPRQGAGAAVAREVCLRTPKLVSALRKAATAPLAGILEGGNIGAVM